MFSIDYIYKKLKVIHDLFEPRICTLDASNDIYTGWINKDLIATTNYLNNDIVVYHTGANLRYNHLTEEQYNWKLCFIVIHELSHINQDINTLDYIINLEYRNNVEQANNYNVIKFCLDNQQLFNYLPFKIEPDISLQDTLVKLEPYRGFYKQRSIEDIVKRKLTYMGFDDRFVEKPNLTVNLLGVSIPLKMDDQFICNHDTLKLLLAKISEAKYLKANIYLGG